MSVEKKEKTVPVMCAATPASIKTWQDDSLLRGFTLNNEPLADVSMKEWCQSFVDRPESVVANSAGGYCDTQLTEWRNMCKSEFNTEKTKPLNDRDEKLADELSRIRESVKEAEIVHQAWLDQRK